MVTYQEVIGGDHSNNGEMNSRAVALSEGSIYCKKFETFGNSVVLNAWRNVYTGFWKMYQIIPPAWRTHLGNHLFELGTEQRIFLTTGCGLK